MTARARLANVGLFVSGAFVALLVSPPMTAADGLPTVEKPTGAESGIPWLIVLLPTLLIAGSGAALAARERVRSRRLEAPA